MELIELELPKNDESNKDFKISLVDFPAIESNWMKFSKQSKIVCKSDGDKFTIISRDFKVHDEDKRIISGFAMIADLEIPRFDENGEFKVVFRKEAIEDIWLNFGRNNLNNNTNLQHEDDAPDTFVCESIFIDEARGTKAPEGFAEEADGSWFVSMKIEDDAVWEQVKDGTFKGFSIEGMFQDKAEMSKIKHTLNLNKMDHKLRTFLNKVFQNNPKQKAEFEEITEREFETALLVDGETEINVEPRIEVGAAITIMDEEGTAIPTPEGEYELQDGRVIVVEEAGIIAEVREAETETEPETETEEMSIQKADKSKFQIKSPRHNEKDGDFAIIKEVSVWEIEVDADTFEVGTKLTQSFEGDVWVIQSGEYQLEDGRKIQVDAEGVIVMIDGEGNTEEEAMQKKFSAFKKESDTKYTKLESAFEKYKKDTDAKILKLSEEPEKDPVQPKHNPFKKGKNAFLQN